MTVFRSEFMRVISERGFVHQISDAQRLDEAFLAGPVTAYIGFDATAKSLHVGSLIQIMMLHWLEETGNRPLALMGGGTSLIGDPSFKDEARGLLTPEAIVENMAGIKKVFSRFLTFGEGPNDAAMINNADWLLDLNYVSFLREVGRHFSVNRMLSFDSVKIRLDREQSLSLLEFNYMILQAYDFVEINRRYGCLLQMGGSDQWGNIINGLELGRRIDGLSLFAMTSPLLTTASGAKMGKTAAGAVWLNADMLSPWDYWQFWRNTEDADVGRFLKLYTTLPMDEIERLGALDGSEINEAKKILANEATKMLHGAEAADAAAATAQKIFEENAPGEGLPTIEFGRADFEKGLGLLSCLVRIGFANTNGEARRMIEGGAIKIAGQKISDVHRSLGLDDLNESGCIEIASGKTKRMLLRAS